MEMIIYYPTDRLGEVGDPLPKDLIKTLSELAELGWWPYAFGEQGAPNHGEYTEVCLANDKYESADQNPKATAIRQLAHFLRNPE